MPYTIKKTTSGYELILNRTGRVIGTSKLKNIGKDVGGAVRDFKKSVREEDEAASLNTPRTIDAQVKTSESTSLKS